MNDITFAQVQTAAQKQQAGLLIREYLEWLNDRIQREYDMRFDVEAMVASDLADTHKFYSPEGCFLLAQYRGEVAGVGCLRKLTEGTAEIQRMYVLPDYRSHGIGRAIINRLVEQARTLGYTQLRLESLKFLEAAHRLYHSVGFFDIDPYADNSMKAYQSAAQLDQYYGITVFMAMNLAPPTHE